MISLGQRIKNLRMKHGLAQVELAKGICHPLNDFTNREATGHAILQNSLCSC